MVANNSSSYLDTYNRIILDTKRQRRDPITNTRNSISFESNANQAAKTIQEYLARSRRKAEKYLLVPGGVTKSRSPNDHTKTIGE